MEITTASFRTFRSSMGQPVVIALQTPRWMPQAKTWPVCHLLTPRWSYFNASDDEFASEYEAQLDRFGPAKITAALEKIAAEMEAATLVLLCHEADRAGCHRSQFARWADRHGITVAEAQAADGGPVARGPFRQCDEMGRQIVMIGRYSYAWTGSVPLAVGDRVVLPGNRWRAGEREADVTALGSDYAGPLVEVARRASMQLTLDF